MPGVEQERRGLDHAGGGAGEERAGPCREWKQKGSKGWMRHITLHSFREIVKMRIEWNIRLKATLKQGEEE
jgi:hypothetical protein